MTLAELDRRMTAEEMLLHIAEMRLYNQELEDAQKRAQAKARNKGRRR